GKIKNCCILPQKVDNGFEFTGEQMSQITKLIDRYDIAIGQEFTEEQVARLAAEVVIRSIPVNGEPLTCVDGDDMIYLPLVLNLPYPQYDLILTDESQDFNKCQIEAILRFTAGGGRAVVVGDPNQAMYAFRGSEEDAFYTIRDRLSETKRKVITCDLPMNWRCDEVIIEHARQWVPGLVGRGASRGQKKGTLTFNKTFTECLIEANNDASFDPNKPTYAFLCRTNLPLVVTAYALMAMGKRVTIVGKKVLASPLLNIINDLCGTVDRRTNRFPEWGTKRITDMKDNQTGDVIHQGFMSRLSAYRITQLEKLAEDKYANQREELEQNCDCLELISQKVTTDSVDDLKAEINSLFVEDCTEKGIIVLSTAHRAKGLEWNVVFVIRPDLMPHPLVVEAEGKRFDAWVEDGNDPDEYKESEEIKQERNLQYVTCTRAKNGLHYMANWPFGKGRAKTTMTSIKSVLGEEAVVSAQAGKTGQVQAPKASQPYVPSREEIAAETEIRRVEGGQDARGRRVAQVGFARPVPTQRPAPESRKFVDDGEPF
ncbi:MAG: UvrD-helicase domain-containing protein, partial [Minisyncoccia bacterium]